MTDTREILIKRNDFNPELTPNTTEVNCSAFNEAAKESSKYHGDIECLNLFQFEYKAQGKKSFLNIFLGFNLAHLSNYSNLT